MPARSECVSIWRVVCLYATFVAVVGGVGRLCWAVLMARTAAASETVVDSTHQNVYIAFMHTRNMPAGPIIHAATHDEHTNARWRLR